MCILTKTKKTLFPIVFPQFCLSESKHQSRKLWNVTFASCSQKNVSFLGQGVQDKMLFQGDAKKKLKDGAYFLCC